MSKNNKARYSPVEEVGMNAVEYFFLQIGWIKRPQHECDMGIDLHVEECIKGNPTGRLVALQVKSGVSWWQEVCDNAIVFRFEPTHYDYWLNHSLPVLVALYHPQNKKIIWQHITSERCQKAGNSWKIYIPLDHELGEHSISELSTIASKPSLKLAVMREEKYYENLDPRFKVRVHVLDGKPLYEFNAKEDVHFQMTISSRSEDSHKQIIDKFEKGHQVTLDKEELTFTGSPLFENLKKEQCSGIKIQFAGKKQVDVSVVTINNNREETSRFNFPSALMTIGMTQFSITTGLKNSPLYIAMEGSKSENKKRKVSFKFAPDAWFGKSLINLPYFDRIHQLFESIMNGDILKLDCFYEGNLLSSSVSETIVKQLEDWYWFTKFLWKARFIAQNLHINPILTKLSDEQVQEVEILYRLLRNGEVTTNVSGLKYECNIHLATNIRDILMTKFPEEPSELCLESEKSQCMPFLGNKVEVGPMRTTATSVRLTNRDEVERELKDGNSEEVKFVFEGTDTCKVVRQIKQSGDTP